MSILHSSIIKQIQQKNAAAAAVKSTNSAAANNICKDSHKSELSPSLTSRPGDTSSTSLSLVAYSSSNGSSGANGGVPLAPKIPITCQICGSNWRTPSALNIHMRVHTGEKPYKCMICGKGHKQKGQLKVHINKHHPGQWPAFGSLMNQMIKDPKKCSMCGEVFTEPKELSKHILECAPSGLAIPVGQPRPTCDVCGINFSSTLNFKKHMDSHRFDGLGLSPSPNGTDGDDSSTTDTGLGLIKCEPPSVSKPNIVNSAAAAAAGSVNSLLQRIKTQSAMNPTLLNSISFFSPNLIPVTTTTGTFNPSILTPIKSVTVTVQKRDENSPHSTAPVAAATVPPAAAMPTAAAPSIMTMPTPVYTAPVLSPITPLIVPDLSDVKMETDKIEEIIQNWRKNIAC